MQAQTARIFDIYRGTSHDGPGQRDTVFFKGCSLSCQWCHNPEGISPDPLVWWQQRSCIGCLMCHDACPTGANCPTDDGIVIDRSKCISCGSCVRACPAQAMTFSGETWTLDDLVRELNRYKPYYDRTGGGVTVSGGEAMLQHEFIAALFTKLHEFGITTALDTAGNVPTRWFDEVLPETDYVLYDLKLMDSEAHRRFCGADNALILANLQHIAARKPEGCRIWIRTPLIPGATADAENLSAIAAFLVDTLGADRIERWELPAFNNSCISKYERLGLDWPFAHTPLLRRSETDRLRQAAVDAGFPADRLFVTGIIREDGEAVS